MNSVDQYREQERPEKRDEQLEHPYRLRTAVAQTTKRKSLYNQEYGVFARDKTCQGLET